MRTRSSTYHKWLCVFFTRNEWMHSGLLWRPSSSRIEIQEALTEIDERRSIIQFYTDIQKGTSETNFTYPSRPREVVLSWEA